MQRWYPPTLRRKRPAETSDGARAETAAELWLCAQGLTTVARNWRCKGGEIDRVMLDGATLVFVEVRLRSRADFGGAAASITVRKQQRIVLAAQLFLLEHAQWQRHACRFDVMLATAPDQWSWLRDAFS
jgi:putative endonuclease